MCDDPPEDLLASAAPSVTEEDARRAALTLYGIDASVSRLAGERDANFRLIADDGPGWMLKFINPAEQPEEGDFQRAMLRHLAAREPLLPVPRWVEPLSGAESSYTHYSGLPLRVRLVTWLEGVPLHRAIPGAPLSKQMGSALGQLDGALADFEHSGSRRSLLWNACAPERIAPYLRWISDQDQRELARKALAQFDHYARPRLAALPHQVIHNDVNPHNVLVHPESGAFNGLIDFGDALYAPRIGELATALAYQIGEQDDPLGPMRPFIAGYHRQLALADEEMALLPEVIAARMALSITLTQWRAARFPQNQGYILRHMPRALRGLRALMAQDRDRVTESLSAARDI